ncbi:MAG: DUF3078 domain-containing protein [Bacteroidales bacterium]|nr:DUF3078 domain-containing protein [Bacteroidales bacterium]
MMKRMTFRLLLAVSIFGCFQANAQEIKDIALTSYKQSTKVDTSVKETFWSYGGVTLLTFAQDYTLNWAAGGDPALSLKGTGNYFLKYSKQRLTWDNTLNIDYGMQRNLETQVNTKTTDNVELASNLGYRLGGNWNGAALVKMQTQLSDGYTNEEISSSFMTPGYLITSIGMDYKKQDWSIFISPITGKTTFKTDRRFLDGNYFAVKEGESYFAAFGGFARFTLQKDIIPTINVYSKLELFSDYFNDPEKVDVNMEMRWIFKLTNWLSFSIFAAAVYDYDVRFNRYAPDGVTPLVDAEGNNLTTDHLQFKENFGLSLTHKFSHKAERAKN